MGDTTQPRQIRVPDGLWTAYATVCQRRGLTRAEDLTAHMRRQVQRHGDDQERQLLAEADAEVAERRARKGGRPRQETITSDPDTHVGQHVAVIAADGAHHGVVRGIDTATGTATADILEPDDPEIDQPGPTPG